MGKIAATFLVKVTLRHRDDLPAAADAPAGTFSAESEPPVPTNEELERIIHSAIYDNTTYFTGDVISVTSERTDR